MTEGLNAFKGLTKDIPEIRIRLPYSGQEILMRPFTTKEQIGLLKALEKNDIDLVNEAFDAMLTNCVLNEDFSIGDITSKERDLLLIKLRIESVTEEYKVPWKCEKCEKSNLNGLDLTTLSILEPKSKMDEEIKLSDRDCILFYGITRRKDEKLANAYIKKLENDLKEDESLLDQEVADCIYASIIQKMKIGENEYTDMSLEERLEIVTDMDLNDKTKIQKFAEQIKGLEYNLNYEAVCTCAHKQNQELEWVAFFIL
jgi:hypothetical protein